MRGKLTWEAEERGGGSRRERWGPERLISFFRWAIVCYNLCGDEYSTIDKEDLVVQEKGWLQ